MIKSSKLFNAALLFVAARIYFWKGGTLHPGPGRTGKTVVSLVAGAVLGMVAGITGIGGGIFLVPLIIMLGLGSIKEAAACGSIFIWFNSLAGLAARLGHHSIDLTLLLPIIFSVFLPVSPPRCRTLKKRGTYPCC